MRYRRPTAADDAALTEYARWLGGRPKRLPRTQRHTFDLLQAEYEQDIEDAIKDSDWAVEGPV